MMCSERILLDYWIYRISIITDEMVISLSRQVGRCMYGSNSQSVGSGKIAHKFVYLYEFIKKSQIKLGIGGG